MKYIVAYTFSGCKIVDAKSELVAQKAVGDMSIMDLVSHTCFEIQSAEEVAE